MRLVDGAPSLGLATLRVLDQSDPPGPSPMWGQQNCQSQTRPSPGIVVFGPLNIGVTLSPEVSGKPGPRETQLPAILAIPAFTGNRPNTASDGVGECTDVIMLRFEFAID
jgi:hypothetical protein